MPITFHFRTKDPVLHCYSQQLRRSNGGVTPTVTSDDLDLLFDIDTHKVKISEPVYFERLPVPALP